MDNAKHWTAEELAEIAEKGAMIACSRCKTRNEAECPQMNCHGEKLARKLDTAIGALLSLPTTLYCLKES